MNGTMTRGEGYKNVNNLHDVIYGWSLVKKGEEKGEAWIMAAKLTAIKAQEIRN